MTGQRLKSPFIRLGGMRGETAPGQFVVLKELQYFCRLVRQGLRIELPVRRNGQPVVDPDKEAALRPARRKRENEIRERFEAVRNVDVADHPP